MDLLQLREKEILETLKKLADCRFAVIGGYAVNAYTLPRFSVDCDIVLSDNKELGKIEKLLAEQGYVEIQSEKYRNKKGEFYRYEKTIMPNFKVSIDILAGAVHDRQTNAVFEAGWILKNSGRRMLKGKTIAGQLKLRIINIDALIVMKFISARSTDIRDVFMLMPSAKDLAWIKKEIAQRADFLERYGLIERKISGQKFKDDLQGVFGFVDEKLFEKHKRAVLALKHA